MYKKLFNLSLIFALIGSFSPSSFVEARSLHLSTSAVSSFTFAELGEADINIKVIYEQESVHFPLTQGQLIDRATLKLHLSHSEKLLPDQSDLIIGLNNQPAANIILTPDNANPAFIDVELPIEDLHAGDNILVFRFSIRLDENGCSDVGDKDLWATIFSDSAIEFNRTDIPLSPDMSQFPLPFTTLSALLGNPQLSIILPPQPTRAELSAAAQIAASLGQVAKWQSPPLWAFTSDQLDEARLANDHLIIVSTAERNPLASSFASGLSEVISPYNPSRLMLIVSGKDDAELLQSAALLTTHSARSNLIGTHVDSAPVSALPIPEINPRATFAEAGFETNQVRGIGLHDLYYGIQIPYDWKMTSEASIELHFKHSRSITSASLMTVFVNGFEISNVRLSDSNADDGTLVIQLSPRQVRAGRNWLHIAFDLHMPRENCKYRYLDEAWAEIPSDFSTLNLARVISEPPVELSYLPSHMVIPSDLSRDIFILPAAPTIVELSSMLRVSAKLGTFSNADGVNIQAATADQFDAAAQPDIDVLAIGNPASNTLMAKYDANLPQPLKLTNGAIIPAGSREPLPEELNGQAGYIQVLYAPWSSSRSAFIVLGAQNADQLYQAADAFPSLGKRLKVEGNVAIVTADQVTDFNFGTFEAGAFLSSATRVIIVIILVGAILVMGIIGIVVARMRRK
jgi:hypothetical protein